MHQNRSRDGEQEQSFQFNALLAIRSGRLRKDSTDLVLTGLGEVIDSEPKTQNSEHPDS
jgi:hypothetical protein